MAGTRFGSDAVFVVAVSKKGCRGFGDVMPRCRCKTKKSPSASRSERSARALAPEDVRVGDGVTVSHVTVQILAAEDPPLGDDQNRLLHARMIPDCAGVPLRVQEVCLPFVVVRSPFGGSGVIDLRRHHLFWLEDRFTRRAFKRLAPDKQSKAKSKRKKK